MPSPAAIFVLPHTWTDDLRALVAAVRRRSCTLDEAQRGLGLALGLDLPDAPVAPDGRRRRDRALAWLRRAVATWTRRDVVDALRDDELEPRVHPGHVLAAVRALHDGHAPHSVEACALETCLHAERSPDMPLGVRDQAGAAIATWAGRLARPRLPGEDPTGPAIATYSAGG